MKKVELHVHLDGSLSIPFMKERIGHDIEKEVVAVDCKTLKDYLKCFDLPISLLQEKENIENFSYQLTQQLKEDEVIYAEIRFCPLFHTNVLTPDQVVEAVLKGLSKEPKVKTNLILCMMRHFKEEQNEEVIELTRRWLGKGVVGIDLAGDEANYPTRDFQNLFLKIREYKIPFTIHAGEADSYQSVEDAIEFGAKRIGHGVRSVESVDTLKKIKEKKILLEVCPTSNVDTHLYSNIAEHPIKQLIQEGILVSINTDNRTVSNVTLKEEYEKLKKYCKITDQEILMCNLNAVEASFLKEEEKEQVKQEIIESCQ